MKRVAFSMIAVTGAICGAVLAAGPASAAIPPSGVYCMGTTCVNSTSLPQVVSGTAVCPTGISLPVNALIEPFSARMIGAVCPNGAQPLGLSF
ncbi:hypothetical protein [Nocardia australiensis]|uniref:hypothetical protein n=1 Tax=Nocardia australiensis TaxID=2887191 RepID=UPI001D15835C|nr:hypothetical protein [Nocardia australiensis]